MPTTVGGITGNAGTAELKELENGEIGAHVSGGAEDVTAMEDQVVSCDVNKKHLIISAVPKIHYL